MIPRKSFTVWMAILWLATLAALFSCQSVEIVEESPSDVPGSHYVHFRVADSASIPDSLLYRSRLDSGSESFSVQPDGVSGLRVRLFPFLHQIGERDSMAIHCFRLGLHTGISFVKRVDYMELSTNRMFRTGADSLAVSMLRSFDSLRKATPGDFEDTSTPAKRAAFQQAVAEFVFRGNPSIAAYKRLAPIGLDTAKVNRQILTLAAKSGLTLGEVVKQWNLAMDYPSARRLIAALTVDSSSLNPFQLETALRLDTLHLGEAPVGLLGKLLGKKGIKSIEYVVENDSGIRTDRFVLADLPDLKSNPEGLDFAGHPTFAPRANAELGTYTLRLNVTDSLSNEVSYLTIFLVARALDHSGPNLTVLAPTTSVVRDFNDSMLTVKVEAKDGSGVQWLKIGGEEAKKDSAGIWSQDVVVPVSATSQSIGIQAKDAAGNTSDAQIQIRRNQPERPSVTLVEPAQGAWLAFDTGRVLVAWKVDPGTGSLGQVLIDNESAICDNQRICRQTVAVSALGRLVTVPVKAWNSLGLSVSDNVTFGRKPDSAGPVVAWKSPDPGVQVAFDVSTVDVVVSAVDPSGVDSVAIAETGANRDGSLWKRTVVLGSPGEISRIRVAGWDHAGNRTDSVFLVSRAPVPKSLPPSATWISPSARTGTMIPFDSTGLWVKVRLFDLSGIDTGSVKIAGKPARVLPDSVWTARVDLPPTGTPQVITLELKNMRGVSLSDLATVTRKQDTVSQILVSDTVSRLRSGSFWVKLHCATPGSTIRYTLDGSDPTEKSTEYDDSLKVDTSTTLKARGFAPDRVTGQIVEQKYRLAQPVSVSAGRTHSLALLSDGSLWGFGNNSGHAFSAELPGENTQDALIAHPTLVDSGVIEMIAGNAQSMWIKSDATLWCIGENSDGSFGVGTTEAILTPQLVTRGVRKIRGNGASTLLLKADGSLWAAGSNSVGESGLGAQASSVLFVKIADSVADMGVGLHFGFFRKADSSLWGMGVFAALNLDSRVPVKLMDSVICIPARIYSTLIIARSSGSVWGGGANSYYELGLGSGLSQDGMRPLPFFDGKEIAKISLGYDHSLLLDAQGNVYGMGNNWYRQIVDDQAIMNVGTPKQIAQSVLDIAAGEPYTLLLYRAGVLTGSGKNSLGALGAGWLSSIESNVRVRF